MQKAAHRTAVGPAPQDAAPNRCPVCGNPIEGIGSTRPGEHRFTGCGHLASGRFLRPAVADAR